MQVGEAVGIAIGGIAEELTEEKCPFKLEVKKPNKDPEPESIKFDDKDDPCTLDEQENNGGTLGKNLESGCQGDPDTVIDPPTTAEPAFRRDHHRNFSVSVKGVGNMPTERFPCTAAAHHLIPGNAALENSDLKKYMTKGSTVQVKIGEATKSFTVKEHIGYNVNGAHNGVWLAASYSIRKGKTKAKLTWSALAASNPDWCLNYIAAVVKTTESQFHDTHEPYSNRVLELLNKIFFALEAHQKTCNECREKLTEIAPPYMIKDRLYRLSDHFRTQLLGPPMCWKEPWITTEKWAPQIFDGTGGLSKKFLAAYNDKDNRRVIALSS